MSLVQFQSMPRKKIKGSNNNCFLFSFINGSHILWHFINNTNYCMKLPIQIRFNDVDQMGHINNAVIMEYFDLGKSEYFSAVGIPPEQGLFTVVIVHLEVDFASQIRFHDNIHVTTHIERIGNKSVTMLQQVVNSDNGTICATCRTILSGYSRVTNTSAPIPDNVRQDIENYEQANQD